MDRIQNQEFDEFNQDFDFKPRKLDFKNNPSSSYRTVVDLEIENVRDINDDVLLQIGQTVEHKKFGIGRIKDIDGTKAVVDFDKHGTKKLISDFLKPC